ncbi:MAG: hypothetical protein V4812_02890 [Pseudomonadota bacterium]
MPLNKRQQVQIERRLIDALTRACETAKAEMVGFAWLTHVVDYHCFPSSLRVVWVFDTQGDQDRALANDLGQRMRELTAQAFGEADIHLSPVAATVSFDNEAQCQRANAGNWPQRLARLLMTRH